MWIQGKTGYPIVDAAMRQLVKTGCLHNPAPMIVDSFLSKHLLINWQWSAFFFIKQLVDGDFANNGGSGFSSSCGVDAQPYFRIFNPTTQSQRFDPDGDYIRKWVSELKDFPGCRIHEPHANDASLAENASSPRPIVEYIQARQRALQAFKR